jgi:hypothetical protein
MDNLLDVGSELYGRGLRLNLILSPRLAADTDTANVGLL